MDRAEIIGMLARRARESESAMVRVLSAREIEWLVEPLLPSVRLVGDDERQADDTTAECDSSYWRAYP